jgi:splicing factor 3A subunit 1
MPKPPTSSFLTDATQMGAVRFTSGLILPPPEIRCEFFIYRFCVQPPTQFIAVIDRTALFVARSANPPQFEERVWEGQRSDPKFSFLNPADPYHGYYRHKMEKVAQGELEDDTTKDTKGTAAVEPKEPVDLGLEPPLPDSLRLDGTCAPVLSTF